MTTRTCVLPTTRPDCGHIPLSDGIGTGFATNPATGATACYACADEQQRDALNHANRFAAYVAPDRATLTTWSGGHLATIDPVDRHQVGQCASTPTGARWTRFTWHATDGDGGRWFGTNGGPGLVVFLCRLRVCAWPTGLGDGRQPRYCHRRATQQVSRAPHILYCHHHASLAGDLYAWISQSSTTR